ncbi:MAG: FHA domain-containing protein, partial [Myxococcales bacterium]|nr:FHA domain-containing protein [Myxococcales bacterium]
MLKVVVHEKGGRTQRFDFDGDKFAVGREDDNDLVLDRVNISKYHLRFRRHQGRVEVMDLGSTNGTYVNGRKVDEPRAVRRSDRIYVGDYILMLEGDEEAIAPVQHSEIIVAGHEGHPMTRAVAVPPPARDHGEPLPTDDQPTPLSRLIDDDSDLLTSARRVAPAGVESTYLDRIANRVMQTVLVNVAGLDPYKASEVSDEDRATTIALVDSLLRDMERAGELEEGVHIDHFRDEIVRELIELGPLSELMKDERIREI